MHHKLDLGPNMLPGAQQHTTVDSAAALSIQEKYKGTNDENIHIENGQYRKMNGIKGQKIWYLN